MNKFNVLAIVVVLLIVIFIIFNFTAQKDHSNTLAETGSTVSKEAELSVVKEKCRSHSIVFCNIYRDGCWDPSLVKVENSRFYENCADAVGDEVMLCKSWSEISRCPSGVTTSEGETVRFELPGEDKTRQRGYGGGGETETENKTETETKTEIDLSQMEWYINKKSGIGFQYPSSWKVEEVEEKLYDFIWFGHLEPKKRTNKHDSISIVIDYAYDEDVLNKIKKEFPNGECWRTKFKKMSAAECETLCINQFCFDYMIFEKGNKHYLFYLITMQDTKTTNTKVFETLINSFRFT